MTNGTIYVMLNKVDGRVYVGQTSKPVQERIEQHLNCDKRSGVDMRGLSRVDLAIAKLGRSCFTWCIAESHLTDKSELNGAEVAWIGALNSADPAVGYNQTLGNSAKASERQVSESDLERVKAWIAAHGISTKELAIEIENEELKLRLGHSKKSIEKCYATISLLRDKVDLLTSALEASQVEVERLREMLAKSAQCQDEPQAEIGQLQDQSSADDRVAVKDAEMSSNVKRWVESVGRDTIVGHAVKDVSNRYKRWCEDNSERAVGPTAFNSFIESDLSLTRRLVKASATNYPAAFDFVSRAKLVAEGAKNKSVLTWVEADTVEDVD